MRTHDSNASLCTLDDPYIFACQEGNSYEYNDKVFSPKLTLRLASQRLLCIAMSGKVTDKIIHLLENTLRNISTLVVS